MTEKTEIEVDQEQFSRIPMTAFNAQVPDRAATALERIADTLEQWYNDYQRELRFK